jgi:hypothetical protein
MTAHMAHPTVPYQVGAMVCDAADSDRRGKITRAGIEVSEVRYDDGAERNVPNVHRRSVEASPIADGFSQLNPLPISEVVRLGQEAMERKRRGWEDRLAIGKALEAGRAEVIRSLHTNKPHGRRFEKAMGGWLIANRFKEINKATRSQLLDCLKHKTEIEKWRAQLTDSERWKFNHPDTVLKKWKASTVVPDPNASPKVTPYAKLQTEHMALIEERDRYKAEVERGGGDLWTAEDRPRDIARVILTKLTKTKAEKVAREIFNALKKLDERGA